MCSWSAAVQCHCCVKQDKQKFSQKFALNTSGTIWASLTVAVEAASFTLNICPILARGLNQVERAQRLDLEAGGVTGPGVSLTLQHDHNAISRRQPFYSISRRQPFHACSGSRAGMPLRPDCGAGHFLFRACSIMPVWRGKHWLHKRRERHSGATSSVNQRG